MSKPVRIAYTITENKKGGKFWEKIGAVFENKDGSETLVLNSLPFDGRIQLRKPTDKDSD